MRDPDKATLWTPGFTEWATQKRCPSYNNWITQKEFMRIVSRKILREFWEQHPDVQSPLEDWYKDARAATWKTPTEIKNVYRNASLVANNRVVFNIKGNKYRLVVAINYEYSMAYIRFMGTHEEYNKIDVTTI